MSFWNTYFFSSRDNKIQHDNIRCKHPLVKIEMNCNHQLTALNGTNVLFIYVNKIEITNIDPLLIFALIMIYGWYFDPLPYFCPFFYHDDAVMGLFDGALRIDGFH
mmetsp:Transcript_51850/g.62475  ORF Transcript_51850/g.62475 Transcript_51850/m.62475 type:complete len:106 (-) Transcript_51850:1619-1936(-)